MKISNTEMKNLVSCHELIVMTENSARHCTLLLLVTFEVVSLCTGHPLSLTDLSKTGPLIIPQLLGEWLTELCRWHPSSLYRFREIRPAAL